MGRLGGISAKSQLLVWFKASQWFFLLLVYCSILKPVQPLPPLLLQAAPPAGISLGFMLCRSMLGMRSSCTCGCSRVSPTRMKSWVSTVTRAARRSMMNWLISNNLLCCVSLPGSYLHFLRAVKCWFLCQQRRKKMSFFSISWGEKLSFFYAIPFLYNLQNWESQGSPITCTNVNPTFIAT